MTWLLEEKYRLPIYLPDKEDMSEEEFFKFCAANSHLKIERDENKQVIVMPPVGGETGNKHIQIAVELELWNRKTKSGKTFDSSTGFELPDGSMRSPDASWVTNERWDQLTEKERKKFLRFAPDFVIEVLSSSDNISYGKMKMNKWIQNGTKLAWLIIPKNEHTYIYHPDGTIVKIKGFDKKVSGENVLPGFELDLSILLEK